MAFPIEAATKTWIKDYDVPYLVIDCGDWTYGHPELQLAPEDLPRCLRIGRYCSIGPNVTIFVGRQGRHVTKTLTTYPLLLALKGNWPDLDISASAAHAVRHDIPLDVSIGDDVWIGARAIIMAGVSIGTGAVIGAGAVVTKDVPPFGIAIGAPANVNSYRHEPAIIDRILASRWWELEPDELWVACGSELASPDVETVVAGVETFRARRKANEPPLANRTPEEIHLALTSPNADERVPHWPPEDVQKRFTGGSGVPLLRRAITFVDAMEKDGAFETRSWRGLDFGCGWGRIASYLLAKSLPEQLDMCDAWNESLNLARRGGFKNRIFKISDIVRPGEIEQYSYDFCYAMSVFTHLSRESFEANLRTLIGTLKISGNLYFTVRHRTFLDAMIARGHVPADTKPDDDGFWHITYPNRSQYGETVIEPSYLEKLAGQLGALQYLGLIEHEQHLYRIRCAA